MPNASFHLPIAALEDYARSIIEPGSSQTTSMQAALQQLHNLSVPNLEVVSTGFLRRTLRSDIFYKLFLAINGKVAERVGGMPYARVQTNSTSIQEELIEI